MSNSKPDSFYRLVLLRHGQSVGNAEQRFQGQADFPLSETGRAQARALGERWKAEGRVFDQVIASPLLRARQTAEIIVEQITGSVELDPDWMEWDNGQYAGLTNKEIEAVGRPPFVTPYTPMGQTGESRWELYLRAGQGIQKLLQRPPGRYLVVAHGGVLGMALYGILGMSLHANSQGPRFHFQNTAFATLEYDAAIHRWHVWGFNDHAHWKFTDEE
jgi:broad specificity phosphatase PhoE